MRLRPEIPLIPILTLAILLSASSSPRELVLPAFTGDDFFAVIFLLLVSFLAFNIIIMRHEIVELIRELLRRDERKLQGRSRNFLSSILFNLILLLIVFLIFNRGSSGENSRIMLREGSTMNQSPVLLNTSITSVSVEQTAGHISSTQGTLYKFTPAILAAILAITVITVLLAFREKDVENGKEEVRAFQAHMLRESRNALLSLKSNRNLREIIVELYNSLCRELEKSKIPISGEMTAREIMRKTMNLAPHVPVEPLVELTYLFEKALYSNHEMFDEDKVRAERSLLQIISSLESGARYGAN
ncbi:DUF4129 domain-containing protein [Infirmifilum uzonense]|uniref:DUF4129 domain-containing protein n=1 Tax=Infirmifilum TaxID=2856573 RepID=UPI003C741136